MEIKKKKKDVIKKYTIRGEKKNEYINHEIKIKHGSNSSGLGTCNFFTVLGVACFNEVLRDLSCFTRTRFTSNS